MARRWKSTDWDDLDAIQQVYYFVFGGSTTFGYGESDNLTIPSNLQYYLREAFQTDQSAVYNFGRAFYFSSQERWLFESLLADGLVPDLAIFIDGLNDFFHWDGQPADYSLCDSGLNLAERLGNSLTCEPDELCLPVQRFAFNIFNTPEEPIAVDTDPAQSQNGPPPDDLETNRAVLQRWLENKQLIEEGAAAQGWMSCL